MIPLLLILLLTGCATHPYKPTVIDMGHGATVTETMHCPEGTVGVTEAGAIPYHHCVKG